MAAAISGTAQRIADLIIKEACFLSGVQDELEQLQSHLNMMLSFLRDADNLQHQPHRVQNWVAEIRDLAYEAEDLIDAFLVKVTMKRTSQRKCGFTNNGFSNFCREHKDLHQIGTRIITIKDRIADISTNLQIYGIRSIGEGEGSSNTNLIHESRRSYPHIEEKQVIGFDAIIIDVEKQLLIVEEELRVVSIVGMGGLGKTTLAKKVYNSHVMQHFDCCSWVFVSQQFSLKDALVGILADVEFSNHTPNSENGECEFELVKMKEKQQFKSNLEKMKEEDLVTRLHTVLRHKRYFVVLDDIWTRKVWNCLKPAFPDGKKGSKVLFTTRNKEIALFADPKSPLIEPSLLTNDKGWELLRKKAVLEGGYWVPELEELGRDMVKKCEGLPLAIVILGGLLATKKSSNEWKMVSKNLNAHFIRMQHDQQYDGLHGVLALSYHDLPFHLKPCFLYLSQFPEDSEIHKKTLIRLWIAEGFISQPQAGESVNMMEDTAEEYLEELINRYMLEVSEKDYSRIAPKTCHMHDLVRDMCISRAKDENFLKILKHRENVETNSPSLTVHSATSKPRRIAIHPRMFGPQQKQLYVPLLKGGDPCLRSLFYYVEPYRYQMSKQQMTFILKNFKLLRVLIIDYARQNETKNIPREIGKLIHLRYLGLRGVGLNDNTKCIWLLGLSSPLPTSIGNLRSLCTLDLRWNWNISLPKVFHKLECLRQLLVHGGHGDLQLHEMENLETLKKVRAKTLIRNNALLKFPNLQNLGVVFEDDEVMVLKDYPLFELGPLRFLDVSNNSKTPIPMENPLSKCQDLIKLKIEGAICDSLDHLPASLAKLILRRSQLEEDVMNKLEKLPNLRFLHLGFRSYKGSKMVCSANGFPLLEKLELHGLLELKEWEIEEGAMPCINILSLGYLKELEMIPQGLMFFTTLKELKLVAMKAEFERRIQVIDGNEGQDFHKVQHIPSIIIQQR